MLSPRDQAVLDIAARWYRQPGARVEAIRTELGLTETRYAQLLAAIIDQPDAWEYAPGTVASKRRLRDKRTAARAGRSRRAAWLRRAA